MLFMPPGTSRLKRIHGAHVSEEEVSRVVEFIKGQASPEFQPGFLDLQAHEAEAEEMGDDTHEKFLNVAKSLAGKYGVAVRGGGEVLMPTRRAMLYRSCVVDSRYSPVFASTMCTAAPAVPK